MELTNEQLCELAQGGDLRARDRLVENNLPHIRQRAEYLVSSPLRQEWFSSCGIEADDLVQAGAIGLWMAIGRYDASSGVLFLTYAAKAVRSSMSDLIRKYSQDAIWRMRMDRSHPMKIIPLDESVEDEDGVEDTATNLLVLPGMKTPEQLFLEKESAALLHAAMGALPERESIYIQYRFGFPEGRAHPLTETAEYFHLTESRARGIERSALKSLRRQLMGSRLNATFPQSKRKPG